MKDVPVQSWDALEFLRILIHRRDAEGAEKNKIANAVEFPEFKLASAISASLR
jgi:hypothetical protein